MHGLDADADRLALGEVEAFLEAADGSEPELAQRQILEQLAVPLARLVSAQLFEDVGVDQDGCRRLGSRDQP